MTVELADSGGVEDEELAKFSGNTLSQLQGACDLACKTNTE